MKFIKNQKNRKNNENRSFLLLFFMILCFFLMKKSFKKNTEVVHMMDTNCDQIIARRLLCSRNTDRVKDKDVWIVSVWCLSVRSITDQVLNGKTSLWKVSSSKRDPKKEHLQDLIARFWDVDEISGTQRNWRIIWSNDVFERFWKTENKREKCPHNRPFGRLCSACLI